MPTNELRGFLRDHLILGSVEVPEQRQGEDVDQSGPPAQFRTPAQFCTPAAGDPEVEDASTSDRWHNRRKYLDRPAAIQGEIVDPIEHDNNVADAWLAFDVEAIADKVLAYDAASETYQCIVGPFTFWAIVRNHEIQED